MSDSAVYVYLECIKVRSKLRVRITSPGYLAMANCMFPREIRAAGRKYRVPADCVSLITTRGKYYYSVKRCVEVLADNVDLSTIHIYQDDATDECAICMANAKDTVVNPCGHYYMCGGCAASVRTCPICRGPVTSLISKSEFGQDD